MTLNACLFNVENTRHPLPQVPPTRTRVARAWLCPWHARCARGEVGGAAAKGAMRLCAHERCGVPRAQGAREHNAHHVHQWKQPHTHTHHTALFHSLRALTHTFCSKPAGMATSPITALCRHGMRIVCTAAGGTMATLKRQKRGVCLSVRLVYHKSGGASTSTRALLRTRVCTVVQDAGRSWCAAQRVRRLPKGVSKDALFTFMLREFEDTCCDMAQGYLSMQDFSVIAQGPQAVLLPGEGAQYAEPPENTRKWRVRAVALNRGSRGDPNAPWMRVPSMTASKRGAPVVLHGPEKRGADVWGSARTGLPLLKRWFGRVPGFAGSLVQ